MATKLPISIKFSRRNKGRTEITDTVFITRFVSTNPCETSMPRNGGGGTKNTKPTFLGDRISVITEHLTFTCTHADVRSQLSHRIRTESIDF